MVTPEDFKGLYIDPSWSRHENLLQVAGVARRKYYKENPPNIPTEFKDIIMAKRIWRVTMLGFYYQKDKWDLSFWAKRTKSLYSKKKKMGFIAKVWKSRWYSQALKNPPSYWRSGSQVAASATRWAQRGMKSQPRMDSNPTILSNFGPSKSTIGPAWPLLSLTYDVLQFAGCLSSVLWPSLSSKSTIGPAWPLSYRRLVSMFSDMYFCFKSLIVNLSAWNIMKILFHMSKS